MRPCKKLALAQWIPPGYRKTLFIHHSPIGTPQLRALLEKSFYLTLRANSNSVVNDQAVPVSDYQTVFFSIPMVVLSRTLRGNLSALLDIMLGEGDV